MPAGLNTALPLEHYLSRRLTFQTPFVKTGVLLGEIPAGAVIAAVNVFGVQAFAVGAACVFSFNPDLSAPWASFPADATGFLGGGALAPEVNFVQSGKVYVGVQGADASGGVCIPSLRFYPQVA